MKALYEYSFMISDIFNLIQIKTNLNNFNCERKKINKKKIYKISLAVPSAVI